MARAATAAKGKGGRASTAKTQSAAKAKPAATKPAATKPAATKPAAKPAAKPATKAAPPKAVKAPAKAASAIAKPKKRAMPKIDAGQRQHYIEVAAYYIAERRGFIGGCHDEDWAQAEREIDSLLREGKLSV